MLFADTGVEDNGNDDDEEVKDVAEEVEGCSSGGRDDNIARQGIHWIVVQDEIDPEIMTSGNGNLMLGHVVFHMQVN